MKAQIQDGAIEVEALGQQIIIRSGKAAFPAGLPSCSPSSGRWCARWQPCSRMCPARSPFRVTPMMPPPRMSCSSPTGSSSQRAVAVAHQMIKVPGFDGGRLVVQGMADSQPLVPNTSPENRRMNRRVEISIMQGKPTVSAPISAQEQK